MRSTFSILFYLNTSKRKKSGLCPVMGRITVDGGIAQFSLKKDAHPDTWDAGRGRVTGKSREQTALNRIISQTEQSVRDIYMRMVEKTGYVTAEQIKNALTGAGGKTETLLKLFEEHNLEYEKRVGIDRAGSSYYIYVNSRRILSGFIKSKYGPDDFPLTQLDMPFINNYDFYLRVDVRLSANTMVRHIIILKKLVTRAINQGLILRDPFPDYVPNRLKWNYLHVSDEELERIMSARILSKSLCFARDMFVFSCFTGLAYIDMCRLSEKHLRKAPDESTWIDISRQKTGVESNIRLLDIPTGIIEKYRTERKSDRLFNMMSSSNISKSMRKLETLCGIKHLHFHMARHTFATRICMTHGVSMETIGKMMGHNSIRSTHIYAEITGQKIGEDMKRLSGRINGKFEFYP
jgi:site-specific recombinase XerD